jgi:8-hydroxy-5-deazaflavin:NADPH oxidoreductase
MDMNIGVLGSGVVGQTIAGKLAEIGHQVTIGTRDPQKLQEWKQQTGENVEVALFADAAAHGEILINATSGFGAIPALELAGANNLREKIVIDISNPLDFSKGFPPTLSVVNDDSLGEQIQRAFPEAKVVKGLNTVTAALMVNPGQLADGDHHLFICGNDTEAKVETIQLLKEWFGWKNIIDMGDITMARGTEMMLPLWLRLYVAFGNPMFNFKIVL